MKSLQNHDVWDRVDLPEGKRVVGNRWVFKVKLAADGSVERHKARLVAQGYTQQRGMDYKKSSPIVHPESVHTLFAVDVVKGMVVHQMDLTTAFLKGR